MNCHCRTKNRAPRWTFTDPLQTRGETRCPGGVSVSCLASRTAMNACDTTKVYIWRLDTWYGPTLYRKCQRHITLSRVEPLAGNCTTSSTRQREQVWQKCKINMSRSCFSSELPFEHPSVPLFYFSDFLVSVSCIFFILQKSWINFLKSRTFLFMVFSKCIRSFSLRPDAKQEMHRFK